MTAVIIHYSPGPFEYNPELFLNTDGIEKIKLGVNAQLKCSPGVDQFGFQFDILILQESKVFLKTGMLFAFKSEGFGRIIEEDPTLKNHREGLQEICKQAWNAAIGALASMTVLKAEDFPTIEQSAPIRSGFILPPLYEVLASDVEIIVRPESIPEN